MKHCVQALHSRVACCMQIGSPLLLLMESGGVTHVDTQDNIKMCCRKLGMTYAHAVTPA
jgi:hypothetical protein